MESSYNYRSVGVLLSSYVKNKELNQLPFA